MPTTPFIGISVVIHVVIIIFHKLFHIKEKEDQPIEKTSRRQYFFAFVIASVMSGLMLFTAAGLLVASVTERHSTIYLVEDTAQWLGSQANGTQLAAAVEQVYIPQVGAITAVALLILALVMIVPRIKFARTELSPTQGGHSLVQVSLFVSGIIAVTAGIIYIVLYLLIASMA